MHKVLLLFIDGLGLGENDPLVNPLARFRPAFFTQMLGQTLTLQAAPVINDNFCLVPIDANLGIPGLPQSATGQTALFTGINAPEAMGRHILGFPGPGLAKIIANHGLMAELSTAGYKVASANMYGPDYLKLVELRKRRHSASTLTILGAGLPLRSVEEMLEGKAVYQDITNESLPRFGVDGIPTVTPAIAGIRLASIAENYNFTLFEYFQTDRQGHKMNWQAAEQILNVLDDFLSAIYQRTKDVLVIVTSDHGNFEDFSKKTHTTNPVPALIWGPGCAKVAGRLKSLTDIKPVIMNYIREGGTIG